MHNPFRYFNSSAEVIGVAVMMYIRYPLSPRQVEDLLFKRGVDVCHETVRFWWNRFGPMFVAGIRKGVFIVGLFRNGDGTWTMCLPGSTVKRIASGAPWITKARYSNFSLQGAGIAVPR